MGRVMKILAVGAIAALGVALCGCATVIDGPSQKIAISTSPVKGAKCVLSTHKGKRLVVNTPGAAKVSRSSDDIPIRCTKDGYKPVSATIHSGFDNWSLGNVLTAGLGFGIDAVTGSINDYPDAIHVKMKPDEGSYDSYAPPASDPYAAPAPDAYSQPQDDDSDSDY